MRACRWTIRCMEKGPCLPAPHRSRSEARHPGATRAVVKSGCQETCLCLMTDVHSHPYSIHESNTDKLTIQICKSPGLCQRSKTNSPGCAPTARATSHTSTDIHVGVQTKKNIKICFAIRKELIDPLALLSRSEGCVLNTKTQQTSCHSFFRSHVVSVFFQAG